MANPTPDGVPCRHCGEPIFWDEYCWVHSNGWATCGTVMTGGKSLSMSDVASIRVNPEIKAEGPHKGKTAEPEGDWS